MPEYSRREIMRAFALGGAVVAGELWIPGRVFISLPSPRLLTEANIVLAVQEMVDNAFNVEYKRYHDLWIACFKEGGAMLSKDGLNWERIKPDQLYDFGQKKIVLADGTLEEIVI